MCSLKIHDNVLLSRVAIECEDDGLYVGKVKPFNKIHAQGGKRNASKRLKFKTKLEQQSTRTTSRLFWCLTSYKVTPFLVFHVAKI